jgi:hypothetical protein
VMAASLNLRFISVETSSPSPRGASVDSSTQNDDGGLGRAASSEALSVRLR